MKLHFVGMVWAFKNGVLVASGNNLVVNGGLTTFCTLMAGGGSPTLQKMAIGNSSTTPDLGQLALQGTEAQRVVATVSSSGPLVSVDAVFPGDSSRLSDVIVREFGIFASDNSMVARWTCADISLLRTDELGVNWTIEPTQQTNTSGGAVA